MPYSPRSTINLRYLENSSVAEVLEVYEHLFEIARPEQLPSRIVLTDVNPNADFYSMRDNVQQWEDDRLPKDQRITYEEVQGIEGIGLFAAISADDRSALLLPFSGSAVSAELSVRIPLVLRPFAAWITGDFQMLLWKRFAWGTKPGILEDIFQAYRAGYFVHGWTGTYPDDIRLLAFPGRDG